MFRAPIIAGTKAQTIRPERRRHVRLDETMQLYTGMRTKFCAIIGTAICLSIEPIVIELMDEAVSYGADPAFNDRARLDAFAVKDGFRNWHQMRVFWAEHHPGVTRFGGVLIRWKHFREGNECRNPKGLPSP